MGLSDDAAGHHVPQSTLHTAQSCRSSSGLLVLGSLTANNKDFLLDYSQNRQDQLTPINRAVLAYLRSAPGAYTVSTLQPKVSSILQ